MDALRQISPSSRGSIQTRTGALTLSWTGAHGVHELLIRQNAITWQSSSEKPPVLRDERSGASKSAQQAPNAKPGCHRHPPNRTDLSVFVGNAVHRFASLPSSSPDED